MKHLRKSLLSAALVATSMFGASTALKAEAYTLILPPISSEADKATVKTTLKVILTDLTKAGDKIIIHDGVANRLIAVVDLPEKKTLRHVKVRAKYARKALAKVAQFLKQSKTPQRPSQPSQVFKTFADEVRSLYPNEAFKVIYMGAMLEHDPQSPQTSMLHGRYPNDAHVTVDGYLSPYGVADRPKGLEGTSFHICNRDDRFFNKAHYKAVHRFWGLSIKAQGGELRTFTDDAGLCLERFKRGSQSVLSFTRDPSQSKPEMRAVKRPAFTQREEGQNPQDTASLSSAHEMPQASLTRAQGGRFLGKDIPLNAQPVAITKGIVKIGIRWENNIDLDLYVTPYRGAKTLSYNETISPEGRFDKDWRSAQAAAHAYEFIEFTKSLTLRDIHIAVNFYSGKVRQGARGVLRIWVEGQGVWEKPFFIRANKGNGGKRRNKSKHWIKIKTADVLGLPRLAQ